MAQIVAIVAATLIAILSATGLIYLIRRDRREERRHRTVMAFYQQMDTRLAESPRHVIPQPRTHAERKSRAKWGMGGLAAVPLIVWARDHHVPAMLTVAAVGGVLNLTPSLAPYETPLPPQAEGPTMTAPPWETRPAPPTQPDTQPDAELDEEPEPTQEQATGQEAPVVTPGSVEPPAPTDTPPTTTEPPPPSRSEPPSQPPPTEPPAEEPPEEEPPESDCVEVLPAPEVDADGCITEVGALLP